MYGSFHAVAAAIANAMPLGIVRSSAENPVTHVSQH